MEKTEAPSSALSEEPRGSEVVLLVEDENAVRRMTQTFLEAKGYKVLEARHGGEGLEICQDYRGPIDLLLTDIVMPEMGGRELVEKVSPLRPEMKVLFMSGYSEDPSIHEGSQIPFLEKPFTLRELARRVREVLDSNKDSTQAKGITRSSQGTG